MPDNDTLTGGTGIDIFEFGSDNGDDVVTDFTNGEELIDLSAFRLSDFSDLNRAAVERPEFRWVNTMLGNIKNAVRGTYHAIRPKYVQRCLSEFEYRFNRRFDLPDIIPRLVYVALRTPPMPEWLLKLRLA